MTPSSPPQLLPLILHCGAILCCTVSFCLEPQYPHQLGWHLLSSSTWAEDLKNCVPPSERYPVCRLESKPRLIRYLETRCYDMYQIPIWMITNVNRIACILSLSNSEKTAVLRFRHSLQDVFLTRSSTSLTTRERQQLKQWEAVYETGQPVFLHEDHKLQLKKKGCQIVLQIFKNTCSK